MIIVELEMEKGRKKRYGVAEGGNGRQAALSLTCPRLGPSFRVTSPPHVNALDAAIVVVNPNVRPGPKHGVSSSTLYEKITPRTEKDSLAGPKAGAGRKFSTTPSTTEVLPET